MNLVGRFAADQVVGHRANQVGLAKAGAPEDHQGVVLAARRIGHRHAGGVGQFVAGSHHERVKSIGGVKVYARRGGLGGRRLDNRGLGLGLIGRNFESCVQRSAGFQVQGLSQQCAVAFGNPFGEKAVGHGEHRPALLQTHVQGSEPSFIFL